MTEQLPGERVLSTLNQDGTRNWLRPKLARGRFLTRRRIVGYALILLFVLLPRIRIGGRPALLIDLLSRELDVFGAVFRPTDGFVLALLGISIVIAVFLVTALFGRVWCGWGCPQTVYLEVVFRPIERWLEGGRGQLAGHWRRIVKWAIYGALSFALANVFLAYFVGTDRLEHWVFGSPRDHLGGFVLVVAVSALILFDFGWFREQTCIVACPYGRLQTVLLDRQSLIVGYDAARGEPRTKAKKKLAVIDQRGDCVACSACVAVCPTGIDIRQGLQMECIGCAQCIDACDGVMAKLGRKPGLIGYTSAAVLAGEPRRLWRMRTLIYPAILALSATLLVRAIVIRTGTEIWVERTSGPSFVELPGGMIAAQARIKVENESDAPRSFHLSIGHTVDAALRIAQPAWLVPPHASLEIPLFVDVPGSSFVHGERRIELRIDDSAGFERIVTVTLLGPDRGEP